MTQMVKMTKSANKPVPCPICKENDSAQPYKPFCSSRCANVDLHRWLGGHYSVPAVDPHDHFVCESCGLVKEVSDDEKRNLKRRATFTSLLLCIVFSYIYVSQVFN
mgnify:CR=1 FL=1